MYADIVKLYNSAEATQKFGEALCNYWASVWFQLHKGFQQTRRFLV